MKKMLSNYILILICSLLGFALLFTVNISYELRADDEIADAAKENSDESLFGKIDDSSYVAFFTDVKEYGSVFGEIADAATDVVVDEAGTGKNSGDEKEISLTCNIARVSCIMPIILGIGALVFGGFCILASLIAIIYTLCAPKKAAAEEKKENLAGVLAKSMFTFPILAYISMWLPIIFGNMALRSLWGDSTEYQYDLSFAGGINYLVAVIAVVVVYVIGKIVIHYTTRNEKDA